MILKPPPGPIPEPDWTHPDLATIPSSYRDHLSKIAFLHARGYRFAQIARLHPEIGRRQVYNLAGRSEFAHLLSYYRALNGEPGTNPTSRIEKVDLPPPCPPGEARERLYRLVPHALSRLYEAVSRPITHLTKDEALLCVRAAENILDRAGVARRTETDQVVRFQLSAEAIQILTQAERELKTVQLSPADWSWATSPIEAPRPGGHVGDIPSPTEPEEPHQQDEPWRIGSDQHDRKEHAHQEGNVPQKHHPFPHALHNLPTPQSHPSQALHPPSHPPSHSPQHLPRPSHPPPLTRPRPSLMVDSHHAVPPPRDTRAVERAREEERLLHGEGDSGIPRLQPATTRANGPLD